MSISRKIPWPKLPADFKVPLRKEYAMSDMWYLDTKEAKPIFEKQADIIIKNQYKGIVDVGCRHGPINDLLHEKNYQLYDYYGFDTSIEPIKIAQHEWSHKPNIEFKVDDWNNLKEVNFRVDVIIFSGVLLYEKEHFKLYSNIMKFYNCSNAIIQEPYHTQKHYDNRLVLNTITKDMKQYNLKEEYIIDAEIFCGRRLVAKAFYDE
jgi:trans-aconitate methyltransferase